MPFIEKTYLTIGLSYILFRILHLLIDTNEGSIEKKLSFVEFINYTCLFLGFISGPIQQYQDYSYQIENNKKFLREEKVFANIIRLTNGYLKVMLLSPVFHFLQTNLLHAYPGSPYKVILFFGACFSFFMNLFFNFSGYMDIAISLGNFMGFNLPENFEKPFKAKGLLEFWSKWHITLSLWFKTYVFNPLMKKLIHFNDNPKILPFYGVFAYLVTFFIVGVWHGSTYSSVIYGILLGFGVSINKLYEVLIRKYVEKKKVKKLHNHTLFNAFTCGLTLSFMSISSTCIIFSMKDIIGIHNDLSIGGIFLSFIFGSILITCFKLLLDLLAGKIEDLCKKNIVFRFPLAKHFEFSIKVIIIVLTYIVSASSAPQFIYQAF